MTPGNAWVAAARAVTAAGLFFLLVFGVRGGAARSRTVTVTGATPAQALAAEVASGGTGLVVYDDSVPPSRDIAGLLAAGATGGRAVELRAPLERPALWVRAPADPIAQRRAALTVGVRGEPGQQIRLTIEDGARQRDTVTVAVSASGSTTTRVAVEPARAGIERWTVRAEGVNGEAADEAWVRPPRPLRVLVLTGPPGWEARYLVRALESSGIDVVVRQDLGRDLVVASDGTPPPTTLQELADYDVVVSDASGAPAFSDALNRWVAETGGGHLLLGSEQGTARTLSPADLSWSGPVELIPLPALDIDVAATPVVAPVSGVTVAGLVGAGFDGAAPTDPVGPATPLVVASAVGRGRALVSGLETWPWVLEGGVADAHAAYWSSVVEWLASGLTDELLLTGPAVQPYTAWEGRLEGAVPTALALASDAGADVLPVAAAGNDRGTVRFVPLTAGPHTFSEPEESPFAAAVVRSPDERLSWTEAALVVGGSGASIVTDDTGDRLDGVPLAAGDGRAWLLFLWLAAIMGASWTSRRVRGLA